MAGRVALITGGASGFGLAVARSLAFKGWRVALIDMNGSAGEEAVKDVKGGQFYQVDVTDYDSLAKAYKSVWDAWGRLDFVFANAGIAEGSNAFYSPRELDSNGLPPKPNMACMDVNMNGVIYCTWLAQHFFGLNETPGGSIVMTGSCASVYPVGAEPIYSAAKAGVTHFTRSLVPSFKGQNIRVNSICPGLVVTNIMDAKYLEKWPKEQLTFIETIVLTVNMLIEDDKMQGQVVEVSGWKYHIRDPPEFVDERIATLLTGLNKHTEDSNPRKLGPREPPAYASAGAAAAAEEVKVPEGAPPLEKLGVKTNK